MFSLILIQSYKTMCFFRCIQHRQFLSVLLEMINGIAEELPDISEDCLYLNIYTPANRANDAKLPVRNICCSVELILLPVIHFQFYLSSCSISYLYARFGLNDCIMVGLASLTWPRLVQNVFWSHVCLTRSWYGSMAEALLWDQLQSMTGPPWPLTRMWLWCSFNIAWEFWASSRKYHLHSLK